MKSIFISNSGDYNVKKAYQVLLQDTNHQSLANHFHFSSPPPPAVWNLLWKVKLPLKICNCIWRLLHDSLPTFHTLKSRGIANVGLCPLCDSDEETATHLFLHFPFFRACWYGSQLAIQTSKVVAVCLCSSGSL